MKYFWIAIALASNSFLPLEGFCLNHTLGPHTVFLGPEFCHNTRKREGGSKQSGFLLGGHFRYDRISPNSLYWALDAFYDSGKMFGKTANGNKIKSTINEYEIQGRLGYSFYFPNCFELLVIPYGAYSYYYGTNKFHHPSPVTYKLHDKLHLAGPGLWISMSINQNCRCGLDFQAKYMIEGKNKVTSDPKFDSVSLEIESEWQYEIDLPIEFTVPFCDKTLEFRFVPFYTFRHYGGKPNYPFDFVETKFQIYGARLLLNLGF
jgi:hypothetical protein